MNDLNDAPELFGESSPGLDVSARVQRDDQNAVVLKLTGYIDAYNIGFLERQAQKVQQRGYTVITLDLIGVHFIALPFVSLILSLRDILEKKGGKVLLRNVHRLVSEVFDLLGYDVSDITIEDPNAANT